MPTNHRARNLAVSLLATLATTLGGAAPVAAEPAAAPTSLRADAEIDPTAYALGGYSLHVGAGAGRVRADLGAFALELPAFIHGNEGWTSSFHGFGAKLQVFARPEPSGGFVGAGAGLARTTVSRDGTDLARTDTAVSLDLHVGWRFELPRRFYATTWIGVGRMFGGGDVTLDGATYEQSPWTIFPAVHVGYHLR